MPVGVVVHCEETVVDAAKSVAFLSCHVPAQLPVVVEIYPASFEKKPTFEGIVRV